MNWSTRIDENITDRQRLSFRFKRDNNSNTQSSWLGELSPPMAIRMKEGLNTNLTYDFIIRPWLIQVLCS